MKRIKQRLPIIFVFLIIVFTLIILSLYKFNNELKISIEESTNNNIQEKNQQNIDRIKFKIEDTFELMEAISIFIGQSHNIFEENIMENLIKQSKKNSFIRMAVTGKDGIGYTQDGELLDISDREYFIKAMQGENTITQVTISRIDGEESIILAVPIYRKTEIIGVLRSVYQLGEFTELLKIESVDNTGISLIIQKDGTSVSRPDILAGESNFFNFLEINSMFNSETIEEFKKFIENKEKYNYLKQNKGNEPRLVCEEIGINDWYIVSIIEEKIYDEQLHNFFNIGIVVIMEVLIFVVLFIIYIIYQVNRGFREIRINEERYRIISEQSNEILFEYDILKDTVSFSKNWKERFGYDLYEKEFISKLNNGEFIKKEDKETLLSAYERLKSLSDYEELEIQIFNKDGDLKWCRIKANTVKNRRSVIEKIFGEIKDVDEEKNQKENLIEAASRDSLTNLYNTNTVNKMVVDFLKQRKLDNECAVIYIDLDNFKDVNDTYGHLIGDEVLKKVAYALKNNQQGNSIVGRIGGDEFFVFIINIELNNINEIAESFCSDIRNIKIEGYDKFYLTASIGISICPRDGVNSHDLYKYADKALYQAKEDGKNRYKIYGVEKN